MGSKSTVARANTKSDSLRATVPEDVVKDLGLKAGDVLDWSTESEKGKKYARFRKLE